MEYVYVYIFVYVHGIKFQEPFKSHKKNRADYNKRIAYDMYPAQGANFPAFPIISYR